MTIQKASRILTVTMSLLILSGGIPVFAQGHLQSWNTNQREKSQRLLSAAITNMNKGFYDKASTLLIEATESDPTDATSAATLGLVYVRQGKYGEALDVLKRAYQLEKTAEILITTGFAYYLQHDYDAAIASWTKALERDSRITEINGDIAFAYMRKGDFAKADEYFRLLIKSRTGSQLAYHGLAVLNYLAGNLNSARRAAEHAETIKSYYPVLLLLSKLDYLQGDTSAAQKHLAAWQKAASNKRPSLRPMTAIGYPAQHNFNWDPFLFDNFDTGKFLQARANQKPVDLKKKNSSGNLKGAEAALSAAKQAQFNANKDYYILREIGLIEMAMGDYDSAATHFREVLQSCPSCVIDWLHLAKALSMQSKVSEASYAVSEFKRQRPQEMIAKTFTDLTGTAPTSIPEMTATPEKKPQKEGESGF